MVDEEMPLVDLMMSQGYPCIRYEKDFNSLDTKTTKNQNMFFPDAYS